VALERFLAAAGAGGASSVLLVSGGGPKRAFDSLAALRHLASLQPPPPPLPAAAKAAAATDARARPSKRQRADAPTNGGSGQGGGAGATRARWPPLYVAFNPYLPDAAAAAEEAARLRAKLATGLVAGVCLQMGTDVGRLRAGLRLLQSLRGVAASPAAPAAAAAAAETESVPGPHSGGQEKGGSSGGLQLFGSVFVPTRGLLARMRFRPWAGVHLSDEFLGSVAGAEAAMARVMAEYAKAGVVPIVEAEMRR
jgi:hypothetical protein